MAAKNTPAAPVAEPPKSTSEDFEEIVLSAENDTATTNKNFIKYVGAATRRVISKKDWKQVGIEGEDVKENVWNFQNDMKLPTGDFNGQQLAYLLKVDGRFKAVDK